MKAESMLVKVRRMIPGLVLILLSGCCSPDISSRDEPGGQEIRRYVGLVRNLSEVDISIPSDNSDATVVLPARRSMEFTVWQPHFKLQGFVDGREVYCQSIRVNPKKYPYYCKNYDFLAEIHTEPPQSGPLPSLFPAAPQGISRPGRDTVTLR